MSSSAEMKPMLLFFVLGLLLPKSSSLDVEIDSFVCKNDLYVSLQSLELECKGTSRCTFGEYAMVKGVLVYNGLYNSGLYADADNQYMYLVGDLSTWTVEYDLMHFYEMPVCWDNGQQQQNNGNDDNNQGDDDDGDDNGRRALARGNRHLDDQQPQCPADGEYSFYTQYKLPTTDNEAISWMTTGWEGNAKFYMYAKSYENGGEDYPIGECEVAIGTYVTPSSSSSGFLSTPSAATTAGIVLAVIAAMSVLCLYCYCCLRRSKRKFETEAGDDITSSFRRMETTDDGERVNVDGKII